MTHQGLRLTTTRTYTQLIFGKEKLWRTHTDEIINIYLVLYKIMCHNRKQVLTEFIRLVKRA